MLHRIYTIRDAKAEAGLPPFFSQNDATACRAVADLVNDPGHQFGKHSVDYTMYMVGTYDDVTLCVEGVSPVEVCPLLALKVSE